jgi:hypothetical protein
MKLKYITLFLITILFASCEKVIEFNGPVTEPLVVVNSFITPDSAVHAQVSLSRFFLSNKDTFDLVNNATVSLLVNGIQKEVLTPTANGWYTGLYHPEIGDSIKLIVQTPGKNAVTCSTTIIPKPNIISVDTTTELTGENSPIISVNKITYQIDTIGNAIGRKMKFVLRFNDELSVQNYYRLVVYTKTTSMLGTVKDYTFAFDDIVSGNVNNQIGPPTSLSSNKFNVFSDDLFNGKQYPLTFSIADNINHYNTGLTLPEPQRQVFINLQSISKSYFLYLQTRASIKSNTFFAEPVQVYSNVNGGIGILGSYTSSIWEINL